jgi:hypothetical protein
MVQIGTKISFKYDTHVLMACSKKSSNTNTMSFFKVYSLTFLLGRISSMLLSSLFLNFIILYFDKWNGYLRYQRAITRELQVGITSQISKWTNTSPRTHQRWDQVPWRSKHPCRPVASAVCPISKAKINSENQCVQTMQLTIRCKNQYA